MLSEDSRFKFGNFPEAQGKTNIHQAQTDFYKTIKALKYDVLHVWKNKDSVVAEMLVTYIRHDGSEITLPVTDVFKIHNNKVTGTYIYMDVNPLYAPSK